MCIIYKYLTQEYCKLPFFDVTIFWYLSKLMKIVHTNIILHGNFFHNEFLEQLNFIMIFTMCSFLNVT